MHGIDSQKKKKTEKSQKRKKMERSIQSKTNPKRERNYL